MIKDSGERTKFDTGAVRDMHEGKGRMDLLPWAAIMEVSKHCEDGAKKYGEHNVDRGIPTSSLCDSGMRHLAKYLDGWTDENHLVAAAWNLLWALEMVAKHPECVNTPWKLMEPKKTCPCCGYEMKPGYKECPNCLVYSGEDDFFGRNGGGLMEIESPIRDKPPCKDCSERCVTESFNCHNSCPKDERGEFGYKAWREKIESANKARREYNFKAAIFSKIT